MITLFSPVATLATEAAEIIESDNFDTHAAGSDYASRTPTNGNNNANITFDIVYGQTLCACLRSEPMAPSGTSR